ncbi:restriction endonuclease [Escherichia coli]|uniref:restriction endonuclease n=1 Tax=Escherichia coli TaxID=562 RepID=UPI00107B0DF1|nr:restriction endonuclease [Escherichia coli]EFC0727488.1 restriction endonuclease [Escherichia coli]EFH5162820.1 hypothetical protein [Escherichia coli]EHA4807423.1 restriction endonuclease [Escherichia coli]EHB7715135.1 restriction endonuclease [Escherichia coli]
MFRNLFKSETTKATEELESFYQKVMYFISEHGLHDAWERTYRIIFHQMEVKEYILEYGALDRKDCFYNLAKEKLVQSAFVSYILVKALPQFFEKHLHTLKRKKMTLTTQDEYGVWNFDKWFKELDYFYENVVQDDIYHWIDNNTDRLNTLWLVHPHNSNAWGDPVYFQFNLPEQFDQCATSYIMWEVYKVPEPELPEYNDILSGHEYEQFVAGEFRKYGADALVTRGSGDHGLDILVTYRDVRIAVQCKHYQSKVGNKAVQEVFTAKNFYDCGLAMVISNSEFTQHARQAARKLDVFLYHHEDIHLFLDKIDNWLDMPEDEV